MFSLQPEDLELAPAAIIVLIIFAAMLQDDLTCTTVGLFLPGDGISIPVAWFACFVGTLLGDLFWFGMARGFGPPLFARPPLKWVVRPYHMETGRSFVDRYGRYSIFLCRFVPGLRTALQMAIGVMSRNFAGAVPVFAVAACVYTVLVVGFCRVFRNALDVSGIYQKYGNLALLVAAIVILLLLWLGKRTIEQFTRLSGTEQ